MIETEAQRIAAVVNLIRPEWRTGLIMSVLEDERMRFRTYPDALVAMVAMAADPTSQKPGRVHEPGRWWQTVTAQAPAPQVREIKPNDCGICSRPFEHHSSLSRVDDHEYEPRHARRGAAKPTPEQRAEIDKAITEARKAATAAREEADAKKELATVDEVLARHRGEDEGSDEREERAS